jgi:hypothetical protein
MNRAKSYIRASIQKRIVHNALIDVSESIMVFSIAGKWGLARYLVPVSGPGSVVERRRGRR